MHTSIYLYWGWYWREVYHYAPLIVAQIVFVYVLDMLVCWSRRVLVPDIGGGIRSRRSAASMSA
jgi:hypothetical protein